MRYILKGITEEAEYSLILEDLENIKSLIGTECFFRGEICADGGKLYEMSDGDNCHEDYIIVEEF